MTQDIMHASGHRSRSRQRLLLVLVLLTLVCGIASAQTTDAPAAGEKFTYIIVLEDRPSESGQGHPDEPDIAGLGGQLLHRWRNRQVVSLPQAAVRQLARHRGVKYVQRVDTGAALPEPSSDEEARIAGNGGVQTEWAPPTWRSGTYVYDGSGNITQIGTQAVPNSVGAIDQFTYDSADRLVRAAIHHGVAQTEEYSYDSFGNLVLTARTAGPSTATPVNVQTNRLQDATYDHVGNVVSQNGGATQYIYDGLNMLRAKITTSDVAMYVYTAGDERIGVIEQGEQRWMVRDLDGRVLREWEGGSFWLWREDYVYRGGQLAAAEREPAEGGRRHFHLDHLGTPRLITDANGQKVALHDYFAFGVEATDFRQEMLDRGTDRPEPMKFTGHERDFTGGTASDNRNTLDYMHARYYSSVLGRFLSVDPLVGNLVDPQSWNRYAYVLNNPVILSDLDGRRPVPATGAKKPGWCNTEACEEVEATDPAIEAMMLRLYFMARDVDQQLALHHRDSNRATVQGLLAFADGVIPYGDPLEETFDLYGEDMVDGLEYSRKSGEYTRNIEIALASSGSQTLFGVGKWVNTGRNFRVGHSTQLFKRKHNLVWFSVRGQFVKKLTGQAHRNLWIVRRLPPGVAK